MNPTAINPRLGVNIDHIATLRQARLTTYPCVLEAAKIAETAGADQITIHLREDRRHIQDLDVYAIRENIQTRLNLEMAATKEMQAIALKVKPHMVTLVPEKREELTTEGGLDVASQIEAMKTYIQPLRAAGIFVSFFVDESRKQLDACKIASADGVEIHTGHYANLLDDAEKTDAIERLAMAGRHAKGLGLAPYAGHGLTIHNIRPLVGQKIFEEYNIGHAIVARAVFVGLSEAVTEMKRLLLK